MAGVVPAMQCADHLSATMKRDDYRPVVSVVRMPDAAHLCKWFQIYLSGHNPTECKGCPNELPGALPQTLVCHDGRAPGWATLASVVVLHRGRGSVCYYGSSASGEMPSASQFMQKVQASRPVCSAMVSSMPSKSDWVSDSPSGTTSSPLLS